MTDPTKKKPEEKAPKSPTETHRSPLPKKRKVPPELENAGDPRRE